MFAQVGAPTKSLIAGIGAIPSRKVLSIQTPAPVIQKTPRGSQVKVAQSKSPNPFSESALIKSIIPYRQIRNSISAVPSQTLHNSLLACKAIRPGS